MRIIRALLPLAQFMVVVACGNSDDKSAGDKACEDLSARLASCSLTIQGVCNSSEPCAVDCAAQASCDQLKASVPSGSFLSCVAACSGAAPDDFVCKDAKGFVKKAGVCDGTPQCLDQSDEADCPDGPAGSGGSGGASGGSGGTSGSGGVSGNGTGGAADGGPGGVSGDGTDGGASVSASPECQAMIANEIAGCATLDEDIELRQCAKRFSQYGPEGCGEAWKAYVDCATKAPFDCDAGPSGCDDELSGALHCDSQFAARTQCTRLDSRDDTCAAATPYSFGCLGAIPSGCVLAPSAGSSATFACCRAFVAP
jgi:hypothetical protein